MLHYIEFILDNKPIKIHFGEDARKKPSTTVLNFLRELPNHKGVKEGCAEGDCGACTVVIAALDENSNLKYQSVNSCLMFLPMLHGKVLITVENLSTRKEGKTNLHPVQEALLEHHGSQCGYCTPGIVMSMFGVYKNKPDEASKETIVNSLAGNLCRCTGYRPILEATEKVCKDPEKDHFSDFENDYIHHLTSILSDKRTLELEGGEQLYIKVFSEKEALKYRTKYPDALIVSGATDVSLRQNKKQEHFHTILDVAAVEEWSYVSEEVDRWKIGSSTSIEFIRTKIKGLMPEMYDMLSYFGSLQVRNVATFGGNIGSASPIGDTLPVLYANKALVELISTKGKRVVPLEKFILAYRKTDLAMDELISAIIIPKKTNNSFIKSYKVSKRTDLDISIVSAAFRLEKKNDIVEDIILAYGGMASTTVRAVKTENFLLGKVWNEALIIDAMAILENEFSPISDARSNAEYRRLVCRNLLMKFFLDNQSKY